MEKEIENIVGQGSISVFRKDATQREGIKCFKKKKKTTMRKLELTGNEQMLSGDLQCLLFWENKYTEYSNI